MARGAYGLEIRLKVDEALRESSMLLDKVDEALGVAEEVLRALGTVQRLVHEAERAGRDSVPVSLLVSILGNRAYPGAVA